VKTAILLLKVVEEYSYVVVFTFLWATCAFVVFIFSQLAFEDFLYQSCSC